MLQTNGTDDDDDDATEGEPSTQSVQWFSTAYVVSWKKIHFEINLHSLLQIGVTTALFTIICLRSHFV